MNKSIYDGRKAEPPYTLSERCSWYGESDFDLVSLKYHLICDCDSYNDSEPLEQDRLPKEG